jgi:hypothetical protein
VEDGQRLHVERRRIFRRIRHLHDGDRPSSAVEQQERLVALAAEIAGSCGVDVERALRDPDGVVDLERRAGCSEDAVHGQRILAARMGASSRPIRGPSARARPSDREAAIHSHPGAHPSNDQHR